MTAQLGLRSVAAADRAAAAVDREWLKEFVATLQSLRSISRPLLFLILLALLVPLAIFTGVCWGWILQPGTTGAEGAADVQVQLYGIAAGTMDVAGFLCRLLTVMLAVAYLLAVNVILAGQLGGAKHAISAFFWMAFLLLLLVPWHSWLGGMPVPMMFYDVDALIAADSQVQAVIGSSDQALNHWLTWGQLYAQYALYPFLGLLTVGVADLRFGRAYRHALHQVRHRLENNIG